MDDTLQLFRRAYRSTRSYAGNFHSFPEILTAFNELLSPRYSGEVTADELREAVQACYPRAAFNPEYTDRVTGNTFEAVRIFFSKAENIHDRENASDDELEFSGSRPVNAGSVLPQHDPEQVQEIRERVMDALTRFFPDAEGEYLMTAVVPVLRRVGIDIKSLGYPSLKDFLNGMFSDEYSISDIGRPGHPKLVLRFGSDYGETHTYNAEPRTYHAAPRYEQTHYHDRSYTYVRPERPFRRQFSRPPEGHDRAFLRIKRFALIFSFKDLIRRLARKAMSEQWYYGTKDPGTCPVLNSYFLQTFDRLCQQDEEHEGDPDWTPRIGIREAHDALPVRRKREIYLPERAAAFNTGLVDRKFNPIYAVFYTNPEEGEEKSPWVFYNFVSEADTVDYAKLTQIFGDELPPKAHYYDTTTQLAFDSARPIQDYNWEHILERVDRLPHSVLEEVLPQDVEYDLTDPDSMTAAMQALRADEAAVNALKGRIHSAVDTALKRVNWNYRNAVPVYHTKLGCISQMLPLALADGRNIDAVLVLETTENAYIPYTIYTLEMAYRSARLLGRPDVEWLSPRRIRPALWISPSRAAAIAAAAEMEEYEDAEGPDESNEQEYIPQDDYSYEEDREDDEETLND